MSYKIKVFAAILLGLAGIVTGLLIWATAVPGESYVGQLPSLTTEQQALARTLRKDVETIASKPHNLAHPLALEASAQYIEGQLGGAGYTVQRLYLDGEAELTRNLEVVIEPAQTSAQTLVIGAHYDSAGSAPGANDNGSGAAALLELARNLAPLSGKAELRLRLVFFVNEEPPYFKTRHMGSWVYAERLGRSGETVRGMYSLETMGYYTDLAGSQAYPFPLSLRYPDRGNFIAFVAMTSSRDFLRDTVQDFRSVAKFPSVGGTAPGLVQGIDWSDHWAFEQFGMSGLMITDTAPFRYPHYHERTDTPDKLDYERLARVVSGLEAMVRKQAQ